MSHQAEPNQPVGNPARPLDRLTVPIVRPERHAFKDCFFATSHPKISTELLTRLSNCPIRHRYVCSPRQRDADVKPPWIAMNYPLAHKSELSSLVLFPRNRRPAQASVTFELERESMCSIIFSGHFTGPCLDDKAVLVAAWHSIRQQAILFFA